MLKQFFVYFGAIAGIISSVLALIVGGFFVYNYIIATFSMTTALLVGLGLLVIAASAYIALIMVVATEDVEL